MIGIVVFLVLFFVLFGIVIAFFVLFMRVIKNFVSTYKNDFDFVGLDDKIRELDRIIKEDNYEDKKIGNFKIINKETVNSKEFKEKQNEIVNLFSPKRDKKVLYYDNGKPVYEK
jgi:hypothetical protein